MVKITYSTKYIVELCEGKVVVSSAVYFNSANSRPVNLRQYNKKEKLQDRNKYLSNTVWQCKYVQDRWILPNAGPHTIQLSNINSWIYNLNK